MKVFTYFWGVVYVVWTVLGAESRRTFMQKLSDRPFSATVLYYRSTTRLRPPLTFQHGRLKYVDALRAADT